jgi:MFS family permease
MRLFHHHNNFHSHRTLDTDFWLFELSVWLHVFGRALIAVFIPILLLQLNYTIAEVMFFYFLYCLFDIPLNFTARWMTRRWGARIVITTGTLASIIFFGILFALSPNNWPLLIALALSAAIYDALYWVAHLYFFMESSKKRTNTTKDTSLLSISRRLAGLLAPAFGGLVLIFFSKNILIGISVIILLVSIIPLLKAKHVEDKPQTPQYTFKQFFPSWKELRNHMMICVYGVHSAAESIIWPIFIFLTFKSIESVAIIPIIVSVTAMIFTFFAGKLKPSHYKHAIAIGSFLVAISWILRLVLDMPFYYFASVLLVGLFTVFISIPVESNIYTYGEKTDPLTASTYMNFFAMISKLVLFGALALLSTVFEPTFLLAAGSMVAVGIIALLIQNPVEPAKSA